MTLSSMVLLVAAFEGVKVGFQKRLREQYVAGFVGFCLLLFSGCKVSDDAVAASQQMTATAAELNEYYRALDLSATETIALYEVDGALSGIPFSAEDRRGPELAVSEVRKREELAASLASLASSMAALSNTSLPSGVAGSATRLGNEIIAIKALPGASPVPDALGKAGAFLLQVIQEHQEKKTAKAIDDTLKAVTNLFERERPAYDSLARTHLLQASQVAQDLSKAGVVDPMPILSPALKPFGLSALPPNVRIQAKLTGLSLQRLQGRTDQLVRDEESASAAMLDALTEMGVRVHLVATEKPMPIRDKPFSLKLVERWAESWSASLI